MDLRRLGPAGLVSSAIGLGTAAFTGMYGPVSEEGSIRAVRLAADTGTTMLDTADFYADGEVEHVVGKAVAGCRDNVLIATHGGMRPIGAGGARRVDGSPAYLTAACEASLRRLRTDYIDIFYLSRADPRVPVAESVGRLAELVTAGKIMYLGLCGVSGDDLRSANAVHPISVLAAEYSLLRRSAETMSLAVAAELGVGVVAYCPLARGLLAGQRHAGMSARDQSIMRATESIAAEMDLGTARLALAWLLARRPDIVPVPGTRTLSHVEMNASVCGLSLGPEMSQILDDLTRPE
jgi:aryl-alcohol dehydrogenase-like predicted oxidoreductase